MGLPAVERGEPSSAGKRGGLFLELPLRQADWSSFRQSFSLVETLVWWIRGSVCRMTAQVPRSPFSGPDVLTREIFPHRTIHVASVRMRAERRGPQYFTTTRIVGVYLTFWVIRRVIV